MKSFYLSFVLILVVSYSAYAQEFFKGATVKKYSESELKFGLKNGDQFGRKMANIGDLDGDGINELAVCTHLHKDNVKNKSTLGSVFILSFNKKGELKDTFEINEFKGGFTGQLSSYFAMDVAALGDLDKNGVPDIIISEQGANNAIGALWVVFLEKGANKKSGFNFKVKSTVKIAPDGVGGFLPKSSYVGPNFANALTAVGDVDGDGIQDIACGVGRTQNLTGSVWILFMNKNGTVKDYQEISNRAGNLGSTLNIEQFFGVSVDAIGDINGDKIPDLAVGSHQDDVTGNDDGSVYLLMLNKDGSVKNSQKLANGLGGFDQTVPSKSFMGFGLGGKVDLNLDGINDLLIGANGDETAGEKAGAIYLCALDSNGKVIKTEKLTPDDSMLKEHFGEGDKFGSSIVSMGDINGDNYPDMAVGAMFDQEGSFALVLSDAEIPTSLSRNEIAGNWIISGNAIKGEDAYIAVYNVQGQLLNSTHLTNGSIPIENLINSKSGLILVEITGKNSPKRQVLKVGIF